MSTTWQPMYDYSLVNRETTTIQFFKTPLGSKDSVSRCEKTFEQTNGDQPASKGLPYPKPFTATGISMCPDWGVDNERLSEYVNQSWIRIYRDKKNLLVLPAKLVFLRAEQPSEDKPAWATDFTLSKDDPFGVEVHTSYRTNNDKAYAPWGYHCVLHGYFTDLGSFIP